MVYREGVPSDGLRQFTCWFWCGDAHCIPIANTKHLYNICIMLDQRRRRWADVIQMLYKCFVFAGYLLRVDGLLHPTPIPTPSGRPQASTCLLPEATPKSHTFTVHCSAKPKAVQLLTCKVRSYCLLALHGIYSCHEFASLPNSPQQLDPCPWTVTLIELPVTIGSLLTVSSQRN